MRYVEAGGLRLSVIGLGTWQFGSIEWSYGEEYARDVAPALVRRALELGITFIDTAEVYGFGRSERIVGDALDGALDGGVDATVDGAVAGAGTRDGLVVGTKLIPVAPLSSVFERQAHGSARRLHTDAIDLYQVHFPNRFVSPRRTLQAMRPLVDQGLVRRVGVSNHSLAAWQSAERGLGQPIPTNQVRFSLTWSSPRRALLPWAQANGRILVAYSPLTQGLLTGKDLPGTRHGIRRLNHQLVGGRARNATPIIELLREVARGYGATPAQVALAWLINQENVVAIPGARTIEQLEENAGAADLILSPAEMEALSDAADRYAGNGARPEAGA